jgi:hypothetical protein
MACGVLGACLPTARYVATDRAEAAAANLADYLAAAGVHLRPPLAAELERLVAAGT